MNLCLFCRIIQKEIAANVLYENDAVLAFKDINPQAPVHVLIVPKKHVPRVSDLTDSDLNLVGEIHRAARVLADQLGVSVSGFRIVVNSGADGGQTVDHLHYHLLGGRRFSWPPG